MGASPQIFGSTPTGQEVRVHTLAAGGISLDVLELGATVHRLLVPARDGSHRNVVLGHSSLEDYLTSPGYFGAVVGRYANRLAGGRFRIDGRDHSVLPNEGANTLHGGPEGFDRRLWTVEEVTASRLTLSLLSPDGDQGFPGALTTTVGYEVSTDGATDEVRIDYVARTDRPTVVNLTNHSYFNLEGEGSGAVHEHVLQVPAGHYTAVGPGLLPTGELRPVEGTPLDFRAGKLLGTVHGSTHPQLGEAGGVDHNFVVDGSGLRRHARLDAPGSGIVLEVLSDQPGVQVYAGQQLDGTVRGTSGRAYVSGAGVALETQHFPDSPNHPDFPTTVLRPGAELRTSTVWRLTRS